MKVGIVCPYSFDTPGGVQFHVRDLAENLHRGGHRVSVLAPADPQQVLPGYVTSVGRAIPVRYNGSVARVAFGPRVSRITQQWLDDGRFDVVHIHEPFVPSCSLIALRRARAPIVATFHSAQESSRVLALAEPFTRPGFERISARIAVSQDARRTILEHFDTDAVVIPNGVEVGTYARAPVAEHWRGTDTAPTIVFLGRVEEPRKGLAVLLGAVEEVVRVHPRARFLIAGNGEFTYEGAAAANVEHLGAITETEKAQLFASASLYVAPQTGGESFGIVLVEAMGAGTAIVASDLHAFRSVLDHGRAGFLFETGSSQQLARTIIAALRDTEESERRKRHARRWVEQFDWSRVTGQILAVYQTVAAQPDLFPSPGRARRGLWRHR